jgi:GT2 family glycosyltransferase
VSDVGVVVIGRNEGQRLRRGLEALAGQGLTVVYVDSGSTDDSLATARALGAEVVELDTLRPFTAARARNAGFERLMTHAPEIRFVQFLDGDCEPLAGWLERGRAGLETRPRAAAVFGSCRERFPDRSVYNKIADIEWNIPIGGADADGRVKSCGGNAMMRVAAFRAVGGFDPSVPMCEEPELCQRLRDAGWEIVSLDSAMVLHDADMLRFGQWARRVCRIGYGALDFTARFGREGDNPFQRLVLSARVWALGWPLTLVAGTTLAYVLRGPIATALPVALIGLMLPAQAVRIAWKMRERAGGLKPALAYGALTVLSKWLHMAGQFTYFRDRMAGRHARLIEYKSTPRRSTEEGRVTVSVVQVTGLNEGVSGRS